MSENKIRIAVIAAGCRSRCVVKHLLQDSAGEVEVAAVFDPDKEVYECFCEKLNCSPKYCSSSIEAVNTPGVSWVMVFSPNAFHKQHILEAFAAGKHVFTEKPLATSIEDCKEIYDAAQKSGKLFATGFVLRYAPIYRKAKEIIDSGRIGRIMSIEANENIAPHHGCYIVCNWRRHTKISGPHILEKCCHDLDLLNWFCGSLPSMVASFGKQEFFVPENRPIGEKYSLSGTWHDPHRIKDPFSGDNDMKDSQVSIIKYRNNILVTFTATMCNSIPERRMLFHGTEGILSVELYSSLLKVKSLGDEGEYTIDFHSNAHGGGDEHIMKELFDTMKNGTLPKCSGNEGLESAVLALALDQAAETNSMVDIEPIWQRLNR